MTPGEPLGWNPTLKLLPKNKKKRDPNSILLRHKKFLKQLESKKCIEKEEAVLTELNKIEKMHAFKEVAAKQREKINTLKAVEVDN